MTDRALDERAAIVEVVHNWALWRDAGDRERWARRCGLGLSAGRGTAMRRAGSGRKAS